jgi:uncharacterized protein
MMISDKMRDRLEMAIAALLLGATATSAAYAQRDPAYQSARSNGLIGEKPDGYLGFVVPPTPAIKALVDDINIKRKAIYTEQAQTNGSTVSEFAFTTACNLISQKTVAGEKYQTPDGTWKTRDAGPPVLDPRCP